ncbi:cbb3-type cytochrome oxidase assembly protein CcoS [bacterium]|nr:cbb3-type cytochrome oxidase assembly protein CcoS [bacterium]
MNVIFVLVVASLLVALGFLAAFLWAVKSGQFEDGYTPSVRMLFEDRKKSKQQNTIDNQQEREHDDAK